MDIKLNFRNQSSDTNNSQVVIFQKNVAMDVAEPAVAWKVIQNCGQGDNHPLTYPMELAIGASDSYGNYTPPLPAQPGQMFQMAPTTSGDNLALAGAATSSRELQVANGLAKGAINAHIYRGGRLVATRTSVAPQQKAVFEFKPTIWIGVVSQLEEGQFMDSAILSGINTELSLLGIASADIVMTGGGPGPNSRPLEFNLANFVMA